MKKKIAVIGGGIYGITIALRLAEKHSVELIEMHSDILQAASGINQFRIHRGYHYPRSIETVISSLESSEKFKEEYRKAIIDDIEHLYCIAKEGSLTPASLYIDFLEKFSLEHSRKTPDFLNENAIALSIVAKESSIDPKILYTICWERLRQKKVKVTLGKKATQKDIESYDYTIICTYSAINDFLSLYPDKRKDYQYELCEKVVIKLPEKFKNKSIVIMDGPFFCIDPYGKSPYFLMGDVTNAIHQKNIGLSPEIAPEYQSLLNKGIIKNPSLTHFDSFIKKAQGFIPDITYAKHIGSMYTIRTVIPYKEDTDERLHQVQRVSENILTVFAGKIANCIDAAQEVSGIIGP